MKKVIKIIGIVLVVLFAALLILPFAFQGKITNIVKKEANGMLNAKLDFDKLNLSFIRNFPKATISINQLSIVGVGEFEKDTLIAAQKIMVTVNLKSIFGNSGYEISKILLNKPVVNAIVSQNGKVNWDIMKPSKDESVETPTDEISSFKLILQNLSIDNANITYRDEQAKMQAVLQSLNLSLKGDMTAEHTTLKTLINIAALNFSMDNVSYLSKAAVSWNMDLDADLKAMKFTFHENTLRLNAIDAGFDGWFALLDNGYDMDINLNTSKIDFKQILSLIPAIYTKDFAGLKASGEVLLKVAAKGKMVGDNLPSFDVQLAVNNGRFQYPDLPKSVDNIVIDAQVNNPGGSADLTKIDVRKFQFEMAGNPFNVVLKVVTPLSDAAISGNAHGKIDLGMIKEVYPLDAGMALSGLLIADLSFAARMSQIEKEQYEAISAEGKISLSNLLYKSATMPDVLINTANLNFTPRYVELKSFDMKIGKNDISANGRLENLIAYVIKNATIKGSLNVQSTYFNLNDLLSDSPADAAPNDTSLITAFEIPKNIDFILDIKFKKILLNKFDLQNTNGKIIVKNGKADLKDLTINALSGVITLNGYYSTATNPKNPETNVDLNIQNASFVETFKAFDVIKKMTPIFESVSGKYSIKLNLKTSLDETLSPNLSSLLADGVLQSKEVSVQNVPALTALAKALNNDKLANLSAKDVNLAFNVVDGRVHTKPFDLNTGIGKLNLSGSTGIDQTIDYVAKIDLPENTLGGKVGKLTANVKIKGTFTNPKIEIGAKEMVEQAITKIVDNTKAEANKKFLEETKKQVEDLKSEAKAAGEKLVAEAEKQGTNLIAEANKTSNAIAKIAAVKTAEAAAKKLKTEAEKQAQKLNEEAEKQAQNLIDKAQIK